MNNNFKLSSLPELHHDGFNHLTPIPLLGAQVPRRTINPTKSHSRSKSQCPTLHFHCAARLSPQPLTNMKFLPPPSFPCKFSRFLHRSFSTSINRQASWGFIGLGQMGYPMAKNLRAKIPAEDTLVIFDINRSSMQRFCQEPDLASKGGLTVANDIKEVVNTSVSPNH